MDKPKRQEILHAKEVIKRWHFQAKARGKKPAMVETLKIWEILDYFEQQYR